ncbi:DUF4132 domain-containing protein [Streptomyces fragilis]|uniref:DUF4132 domain-containing protein n=1 Tax=Streptomyces fragilis TaxID=67301 RepID=A0ABV2YHF5_9ACTN|nr:DUF4132 domain-containing protein [Streptomyces fragilis]
MLHEALAAQARRNDPLDDVRTAALARARGLVDLLERQRTEPRWDAYAASRGAGEYDRILATRAANQDEIDGWLAACSDAEGRAAALCLLLASRCVVPGSREYEAEVVTVMQRVRGWSPEEVAVMLSCATASDTAYRSAGPLGPALDAAERLDADGCRALAPWLRHAHTRLMSGEAPAHLRGPLGKRLRALLARVDKGLIPDGLIPPHAPWAAALRDRAEARPTPELAEFVQHLAAASGPRPSQRWRRTCRALVEAASAAEPATAVLRALAEDEPLCSRARGPHNGWIPDDYHYHYLVHQNDGDLARGLVWAGAMAGGPAAVPHLGALALRAGGPRSAVTEDLKLAGAAINALAEVDDPAALETLWRLRSQIRHRALVKQLGTALTAAAARQGITAGQLVERSVPRHGLEPDGSLERTLGGHRARLSVEDAATVRLTFTAPDGRTSRTAPAAVRDGFPDALRETKALAKEVRGTLSAERSRLEALMSAGREWPYDEWCRHYRDHPVTGTIVRGLIWEFQGVDGEWRATAPAAEPPGEPVRVRLWHPILASVEEIRAWRELLVAEQLRQPFKQAFRKIYLLTPAEQETRLYSNRFAAHIVHYPRLYALFKERGWRANFLGPYDGGYSGEAWGEFADGEWRACFHHEHAGGDGGDRGTDYAATDQVRFERRDGRRWREVPLAEVPPPVFSEAMRDVDLFVAVTSIAADPDWSDRGEDRWTGYWRTAAFGALTASAEVRRETLRRILPRLRIAGRCSLDGRFLVVRGDLRTYRIHLGSANILMEPDDAYLCVVPSPGRGAAKVFLPFEDERLSVILSKAFLLAADAKITDETILRQIQRGARWPQ